MWDEEEPVYQQQEESVSTGPSARDIAKAKLLKQQADEKKAAQRKELDAQYSSVVAGYLSQDGAQEKKEEAPTITLNRGLGSSIRNAISSTKSTQHKPSQGIVRNQGQQESIAPKVSVGPVGPALNRHFKF